MEFYADGQESFLTQGKHGPLEVLAEGWYSAGNVDGWGGLYGLVGPFAAEADAEAAGIAAFTG